jgi:hypothetical protein
VRIGVFLAYWPWFSHTEQLQLAELADEGGLDSVWVSEGWGQDAVSVLATLAMRTERVGICSGVMQIPARQPAATAMAAGTLDVISGGRFRLGLGVSGPQVSEGWYGVPFARDEFTADRITLYANLDLGQIRGYGLGEDAERLLVTLALYKLRVLIDGALRLRTACDLEATDGSITARRPEGFTLPDAKALCTAL